MASTTWPDNTREATNQTVLLVDDEPDILGFMEMVLREEGYGVVAVTSGQEALRVVAEESPALIFVDARMPLMDGEQLIAALHEREGWAVPIVLMTAALISPSQAMRLGVQGFLVKPFGLDELLDCVSRLLTVAP